MANPTTNFGWQMPTSTDLVTDLPADFEVFGQAVDTDFVDLLGGASGYILSKASATDLDFTWIPNDQGDITGITATSPLTGGGSSGAVTIGINAATTSVVGAVQLSDSTSTTSSVLASTPTATKSAYDLADAAIPKSLVTTAGDIIYRNATVPARLGIGTAGQVLKVNSGATAPEWATPSTPAFVGCSLTKVANQTTSAATYTIITFTSEEFDTNGFHDNSTNTGRITIPSGYAGKYLITGQLTTADGNETHTSAIIKNGVRFNTLTSFRSAQSGAGGSVQTLIMNLAVADYVEIAQYSGSGVQVNGTAANDRPSVFACQYLGA
jgi:hypothetical protein